MASTVNTGRAARSPRAVLLTIGMLIGVVLLAVALGGITLVNSQLTVRSAASLAQINVASRQPALAERISRDLITLELAQRANKPDERTATDLVQSANLFDQSLKALLQGGTVTDSSGTTVALERVNVPSLQASLQQLQAEWQPIKSRIDNLAKSTDPVAALHAAGATMGAVSSKLYDQSLAVAAGLEKNSTAIDRDLAFQRNLYIGLAVFCFVFIVGILFTRVTEGQRQVRQFAQSLAKRNADLAESSRQLADAKASTDLIMDTVAQGLMLVDSSYHIESQYSRELREIFRMEDLAGFNLLNILQRILTEKMFNTSRDYLGLLFDKARKERAVLKVNPLDEVEVNFANADGGFLTKFLNFSFRRIVQDGEITRVFVAVSDITGRVQLERQLRDSEHKKERQFELLLGILHVEPRALDDFIATATEQVRQMNDALRAEEFAGAKAGQQMDLLRQRLDTVFRCVHNIKGNAGLLSLDYFQRSCESFENKISEIRNRPTLSGDDFLAIVISQSELRADLDELQELRTKLTGIRRAAPAPVAGTQPDEEDEIVASLRALTTSLGLKLGKNVNFDAEGFDTRSLTPERRRLIKDVLIQLVRNSLAHGIEDQATRVAAGKPRTATISVRHLDAGDGGFGFTFRDDGRGLDPVEIRRRAVEQKILTAEQADQYDDSSVAGIIFAPGFTTATDATAEAGRGMGMDVIKQHIVDECGGEIGVSADPGRYTEFSFIVPDAAPAPQPQPQPVSA